MLRLAHQAALLEAGIKPSGPDSDYDPDATEDEGEDRIEVKACLRPPPIDETVPLQWRWASGAANLRSRHHSAESMLGGCWAG